MALQNTKSETLPTRQATTREEKIAWMAVWSAKNGLKLDLEGECGFGRPCVGVSCNGNYPDYHWYNEEYERVDPNGEVWIPEYAYHKHECVAVLGRGEVAENQLYEWLKWFDENNFKLETGSRELPNDGTGMIRILMGQHRYARMVKQTAASNLGMVDSDTASRETK